MLAKQHFININGQEIHVRVWNATQTQTVFCSHGFTKTSADFLVLGEILAQKGYRVIAPDMLGRGLSQWSKTPHKDYNLASYAQLSLKISEYFECEKFHWVGCDMGALIGILLASDEKAKHLFSSLIVNDIGPEVSQKTVEQILQKAKEKHSFSQFHDAIAFLDETYFPPCRNENIWQQLCESSLRRLSVGGYTLHYDNHIFLSHSSKAIKLWNRFRNLVQPMMVMYAVNSNVLTKSILLKMREIQPRLTVNYYLGCHHPPSLLSQSYCQDIINFLEENRDELLLRKFG